MLDVSLVGRVVVLNLVFSSGTEPRGGVGTLFNVFCKRTRIKKKEVVGTS